MVGSKRKGGPKVPSVYSARKPTEAEKRMMDASLDYADVALKARLSPFSVREYVRRGCPHPATGEALARAIPGIGVDFFCDRWRAGRTVGR